MNSDVSLDSLVKDESHWKSVKQKAFPHLRLAYFEWASIGQTIGAASDAYIAAMGKTDGIGIHSIGMDNLLQEMEAYRANIASFLNAKPNEVYFHTNTTNALWAILDLMAAEKMLKAGDEVLTTTKEFDTTLISLYFLNKRYGINPVFVEGSGNELVEAMKKAITPRTKAVLLSYVTDVGEKLPVEEVVKLARSSGLQVVVDSAQSPGQVSVDVQATGADYYATAGHKWLIGPLGTGIAVIRNPELVKDPSMALAASASRVFALPMAQLNLLGKEKVESFAEYNGIGLYAEFAGLSTAIDFHKAVGEASFARIRYLTEHFRAQLQQMPNVTVLTQLDSPTGMTTFRLEGQNQEQVRNYLWGKDFGISYKPRVDGVRVATHCVNTLDEIDALCAELKSVAAK